MRKCFCDRFPYDIFDRLWLPYSQSDWTQLTTTGTIDDGSNNKYQPPSDVMGTAATPINASAPMVFYWVPEDPKAQFYVYLHFAEVQKLEANDSRAFSVNLNGKPLYDAVSPVYLYTNTIYTPSALTAENFSFSLTQLENSTLPPILNAIEVYTSIDFSKLETDQDDGTLYTTYICYSLCFNL